MAIDSTDKRVSSINMFVGQRILFPNGAIDQDNRQAACRICVAKLAIPTIVFLDAAITNIAKLSATLALTSKLSAAITNTSKLSGTLSID